MVTALRNPETPNSKPSEDPLLLEVTYRAAGWLFFFPLGHMTQTNLGSELRGGTLNLTQWMAAAARCSAYTHFLLCFVHSQPSQRARFAFRQTQHSAKRPRTETSADSHSHSSGHFL